MNIFFSIQVAALLTLALFELIAYPYSLNENHRLGVPDPLCLDSYEKGHTHMT